MDALHTEESVGHSRTRIAAGGHQHIHEAVVLSLLVDKILQQSGHEAGTHILEGQGRTMEEFQTVDIWGHLHHGTIKLQGVVHNLPQCLLLDVITKESLGHTEGNFLKRQLFNIVEKLFAERSNLFGHIEAAVFGQSLDHRFLERGFGCLMVGTVIFHGVCIYFFSIFISPLQSVDAHEEAHKLLVFQQSVRT